MMPSKVSKRSKYLVNLALSEMRSSSSSGNIPRPDPQEEIELEVVNRENIPTFDEHEMFYVVNASGTLMEPCKIDFIQAEINNNTEPQNEILMEALYEPLEAQAEIDQVIEMEALNEPMNEQADVGEEIVVDALNEPIDAETEVPTKKRRKNEISVKERKMVKEEQLKQNHAVKNPCENCKKKCVDRINLEQRVSINLQFWNSLWSERRLFILNSCKRYEVQRRTKTADSYTKKNTFKYFLKDVNDVEYEVCKVFFLTTLGYKKPTIELSKMS